MDFAQRLKQLRQEACLTQTELGKLLGISSSAVGMYEQGRRKPDGNMLAKISRHFHVSVDYLLGNTAQEEAPAEVTELVEKMAQTLLECEGLMFQGKVMEEKDIRTIAEAMKLGVMIQLGQIEKNKRQ